MNPADVRKILFVRPRFLGDICLTLPALEAARAACPRAAIGYVLERALAPLLQGNPRVERLFTVAGKPSASKHSRWSATCARGAPTW